MRKDQYNLTHCLRRPFQSAYHLSGRTATVPRYHFAAVDPPLLNLMVYLRSPFKSTCYLGRRTATVPQCHFDAVEPPLLNLRVCLRSPFQSAYHLGRRTATVPRCHFAAIEPSPPLLCPPPAVISHYPCNKLFTLSQLIFNICRFKKP